MQQLSQQKRHGRHGNHHRKEEMESVVTASGRLGAQQGDHEQVDRRLWTMMVRMMV